MKKNLFSSLLLLVFGLIFTTASAQNPTFYLSNNGNNYNIIEGGTYTFTVNLYNVSTTPVVVNVTTANVTAGSSDFTALSTTVTIPAGQLSSGPLSIATTNDAIIDPFEYFTITGTATSGNTSNTTHVSYVDIIDNDTTPTLYVYNNTILEGQGSSMTIYLSNPFHSDIVLNYSTTTGTASASDFTALSNTITIPADQGTFSFNVFTTNDASPEPDEDFTITYTVTSGNTINTSLSSTITIRDNDTTPTLSLWPYYANENNSYTFVNIYLNRPYNSNVDVSLVTSDGTAGTADYTAVSITKTIPAGTTSVSFQIPIIDDTLDEPMESFTVTGTVTSGNTTNTTATTTVSIVDNDGLPDFFIELGDVPYGFPTSVEEGQNAPFGLRLSHTSNTDTVVQITTTNGTAGNTDYTPLTLTATIPAGANYITSPLFIVPTILDQMQESDESFTITGTVTSGNTYNTNGSNTYIILDNYNLNAQDDNINSIAEIGINFPLLANDTFHGLPLIPSSVTIALEANSIGATVNAQGILSIPSSLPIGSYNFIYTICEIANPSSCDTATISIEIKSPLEAIFTASYSDYNGDGYTSVGDVINFQFTITNNGNAAITNVDFDSSSLYNIIPSGGPISVLNAGQTDTTIFSAIHIVTQNDINFGYNTSILSQSPIVFNGNYYGYNVYTFAEIQSPFSLNTSDGIKVKAFVDTNANGVQDISEIDFPLGHFNYEINNNGTIHNLYTTPFYLYESNPTTTYNLSYTVDSEYATNNSCTATYSNVTIAPSSGITTYNFPITVIPYQDLSADIHNYSNPPRPGFGYYSYITYTNNSNQTFPSGTLTFTKDPAITAVAAICDSNAVITSTGFTYDFTNLLPYETREFWIQMLVPTIPTVSLGQLVTNSITITLPPGDILPLNNTSSITQTIVGSYDPNEKTEAHGGQIVNANFTSNDYLTYTIRFENTGTANAINVNVEDFLDSKLDPSSIKMITASAAYSLERIDNHLVWNFSGINLPPSIPNNETIGHGYIVFQVKPVAGYTIGDIIPNSANIYFDFNPAIVTNTCTTEFVQTLGTHNFAFNNFSYFPNPVKNTLSISNDTTIDAIEITSVLGQKMISQKVNELHTEINLSELSNGIYFVKVTSEGQKKTMKIVKE